MLANGFFDVGNGLLTPFGVIGEGRNCAPDFLQEVGAGLIDIHLEALDLLLVGFDANLVYRDYGAVVFLYAGVLVFESV